MIVGWRGRMACQQSKVDTTIHYSATLLDRDYINLCRRLDIGTSGLSKREIHPVHSEDEYQQWLLPPSKRRERAEVRAPARNSGS